MFYRICFCFLCERKFGALARFQLTHDYRSAVVHLPGSWSSKRSVGTCSRGNGHKPITCKFGQHRSNSYLSVFGFLLSHSPNCAHFLFKNNWQNFSDVKTKIRQLQLRSVKTKCFNVLWSSGGKPSCAQGRVVL